MRNLDEMITVRDYVKKLDKVSITSVSEAEVAREVVRYCLSRKRNETNEKILEALLA